MFVGEGPGPSEDIVGKPLVGDPGILLDALISESSLSEWDLSVVNAVCCFPQKDGSPRPPKMDEMKACSPHLFEFLQIADPEAIVLLSASTGTISKAFSLVQESLESVGVTPRVYSIPHPAIILRDGGDCSVYYRQALSVLERLHEDLS